MTENEVIDLVVEKVGDDLSGNLLGTWEVPPIKDESESDAPLVEGKECEAPEKDKKQKSEDFKKRKPYVRKMSNPKDQTVACNTSGLSYVLTRQGPVYLPHADIAANFHHPQTFEKHQHWTPEMAPLGTRMKTFRTWPRQIRQKSHDLAADGFFYSGYGDSVNCYHCGLNVSSWYASDNINAVHVNRQPDCETAIKHYETLQRRKSKRRNDSTEFPPSPNFNDTF